MLKIEEIEEFRNNCEKSEKIVRRFTDVYVDMDIAERGLQCIINKVNNASVGLDVLDDADRLLLVLIDGQQGINFERTK
jgi:hypothetical protein